MGTDKSTAEKALNEIEGLLRTWPLLKSALRSLFRKHPVLSSIITLGLLITGGFFGYDYFFGVRKENQRLGQDLVNVRRELSETRDSNTVTISSYQAENSRMIRQAQDAVAVVSDVKRERDDAKMQLAPWVLLAKSTFSNAPPDKRLDLLLEKVEPLAKVLERIDALTNSPRPNIEVWADGLLLTSGIYKLPVDSNGVGLINFVIKNLGDSVAENVSVSVRSLTNIQLQGLDWKTMPSPSGESPRSFVLSEISRPINPNAMFMVSTLRVSNDGALGPFEPLTVLVSSARSRKEVQLTCLALPGTGKITPATITPLTNGILISPAEFRQ